MAFAHTFDLQRFADSNVQTTGTQSLSAEMKTYYPHRGHFALRGELLLPLAAKVTKNAT